MITDPAKLISECVDGYLANKPNSGQLAIAFALLEIAKALTYSSVSFDELVGPAEEFLELYKRTHGLN